MTSTATAPTRRPPAPSSLRIPAIDIARGVAVLTMFVAHAQPAAPTGALDLVEVAGGGERPRTLFAVIGGIALGLYLASAERRGLSDRELRREIAVRGVALIALGLVLQTMASGVAVVLDTWGLLFLIALPVLRVRTPLLLAGSAVAVVAASASAAALPAPARDELARHQVLNQLFEWLAIGPYPLLLWFGFLILGLAFSRLMLRRRSTQLLLLGAGAVLATATLATRITGGAHEHAGERPFPTELLVHLGAIGAALALTAALLMLTEPASGWRRMLGVALRPLQAVGAMPLTVYTAHVVALAVWRSSGAPLADTWLPFAAVSRAS
ncbi:DUF1624 domain-containing protein [Herbiconiux sp. CPCC 205716]|uniref:DUF1624 domain-containing protein n=1 Tax=Herbiconiux gentiana TaxID=2970912 RepID=A0ABT2GHY5_9MICO|nr:DUF1624 domain-containing protein [Herbiconiux gentiana]MCS5715716.1 DUF1624 domain-containing protein [Herbiconiux gentiana]